jgi:hypothetical protein
LKEIAPVRFPRRFFHAFLCVLTLTLLLASSHSAQAASFTVNLLTDVADANTADGVCDSDGVAAGEQCTLRAAIEQANALAGDDNISFSVTGTITLTLGELVISQNLTINGPGMSQLTVSGNNASRVFSISSGVTATINSLTVTGGNGVGAIESGSGGGISSRGTLNLADVSVSGNTASGAGGGIRSFATTSLVLDSCTINGNTAAQFGGGIYIASAGTLNISDSTISNNTANRLGGFTGGGIDSSSDLTLTNSTISGNSVPNGPDNGGGIWLSGTATITHCTITNNTVANAAGNAGGIRRSGATVTLRNTIVAANTNNSTIPDVLSSSTSAGSFTSSGYNLIGNVGTDTNFTATGDQTGTGAAPLDPKLDSLANNGGQTQTHALRIASPALDKGNSFGLSTDQRGEPRPFDIPTIDAATGGDNSDIGAFELQTSPPAAIAPSPAPTTNEDTSVVITLSGTDPDDDNLTFTITDGPNNGTLTPLGATDCTAANTCTQQYTYSPNADYNGTDSFKFTVNDGTVDSTEQTVNITINAVNDAPSFIGCDDQYAYNSAPQYYPGWASSISPGPADESGQNLTFEVTNDNNALFADQPFIDPTTGDLYYTPALGAYGVANVTVVLKDDGGTDFGGVDTSGPQYFVITVNLTGWTTSGANSATADESNPARLTYTNFTAAANSGSQSGTYILRYNITNVGNLTIPWAATRLRVRFRDEGAGSRVTVRIMESNIDGGSVAVGTLFDSDNFTPGSGYQTQELQMPVIFFGFELNTYWLEVTLTKDSATNQPGFGAAQLNQL